MTDPEKQLEAPEREPGKINPEYAQGDLVRVAGGRNQTEAEFIQGLLLEEGVPSALQRTRGFDVPDFMAAGPRDVMVPASGEAAARDILLQSELAGGQAEAIDPKRLLIGVAIGAGVLIAVVLVVFGLGGG